MIRTWIAAALLLAGMPAAAQVNLDALLAQPDLTEIRISPKGDYFAMTVPRGNQTGLVVLRRADLSVSAAVTIGENVHVLEDFRWVSPTRLLFGIAEKFGALDQPQSTGEIMAMEAEGGKMELLVGFRLQVAQTGTRINAKTAERVYAQLVDDLPGDDRYAIISVSPFSTAPQSRAERLDVVSGKRTVVARVPVRRASFTTDGAGLVRFARGSGGDNVSKLYYRDNEEAEWRLVNDEAVSGRVEAPLGFSKDGKTAFLEIEHPQGPDSIVSFDPAKNTRTELLRDATVDPWRIITAFDAGSTPVGAVFMDGVPRSKFFDASSTEARLQGALEEAFPGKTVEVTSTTTDGKQAVVSVSGASEPSNFYLFDTAKLTAAHIIAQRPALAGKALAPVRPFSLKARDGLELHGYLTLPAGSAGKKLPMVVMPHGGPISIFDSWTFNDDAQLLANAGYAVLQVNFRGSGGYGRAFTQAGAREWGGKMQDDLTDATRWAIAEGIADSGRMCIYGASYGGYAALMGVAREPTLYRCAVGYVGVYDLSQVVDDLDASHSQETYGKEWIGDAASLSGKSPVNLASQIKVPVLLAAGGEDRVAPISHSKKMEAALRKAGASVETLYFPTEGHGFYLPANRRQFYTKLLAFLDQHTGLPK